MLAPPQSSVHLDVTDGLASACCSQPWFAVLDWTSIFHGVGPGCSTEVCLSLLHSLHCTGFLHSLAMWAEDEHHWKPMHLSFSYTFLSSSVLFLKLQHFLNGCGLLCSGHSLSGSPSFPAVMVLLLSLSDEISVFLTATDVLTWWLDEKLFSVLAAHVFFYAGKARVITYFGLFADKIHKHWEWRIWHAVALCSVILPWSIFPIGYVGVSGLWEWLHERCWDIRDQVSTHLLWLPQVP